MENTARTTQKTGTPPVEIIDCGRKPYAQTLALQLELCHKRQDDQIANTVLVVEHPPVITMGARKSENKLLSDPRTLLQHGIEVIEVGRGGGATAHNPGQLVFYPVIKLKTLRLGVNEYVRALEGIGIDLLAEQGVAAERRKGLPGLWVEDRKIASIGVQLRKWVTFHGMAINICNDLTLFDHMVPCGLEGVEMTSVLKETGRRPDMNELKRRLERLCTNAFGATANE